MRRIDSHRRKMRNRVFQLTTYNQANTLRVARLMHRIDTQQPRHTQQKHRIIASERWNTWITVSRLDSDIKSLSRKQARKQPFLDLDNPFSGQNFSTKAFSPRMKHRMIMCEFQNFWSSPWQNFSQALYSKFATKSAKITKQFWRLMTIAQCNRHNSNGKTSMHVRETNQKFTPGWSGHVSHFFFWRLEVLHILPQDWHSFGDISTTKHAIAKMGTDSEPHGHLKLEKFWSQDDPTAFWQTQAHIWIQGTIHQKPKTQDWHPADQTRTSKLTRDSLRRSTAAFQDDMWNLGTYDKHNMRILLETRQKLLHRKIVTRKIHKKSIKFWHGGRKWSQNECIKSIFTSYGTHDAHT
mgnify:CR=1 FL=1